MNDNTFYQTTTDTKTNKCAQCVKDISAGEVHHVLCNVNGAISNYRICDPCKQQNEKIARHNEELRKP
jgi:hypothetical protein